jgi:hypothetical protein
MVQYSGALVVVYSSKGKKAARKLELEKIHGPRFRS